MTNALAMRQRIARVRAVQLRIETLDLAVARSQLTRLEQHHCTIGTLATDSNPVLGKSCGLMLASAIELRRRLLSAAQSLSGQIDAEQAMVAMHKGRHLAADRDKQMADKLLNKATRRANRVLEHRRMMPIQRRRGAEEVAS